MQKFIAAQQRMQETQMDSNAWWAYYLRSQYMSKEKPDDTVKVAELLKDVTLKSIKTGATKYISGENLITFILMPEKKD
ncbi:hypothetical protein D3C72_2127680 [compost metagenome]